MSSREIVTAIVRILNQHGVPHMLVGSFAANLYREPRSTADADFVIESPLEMASLLRKELAIPFECDPQLRFETVTCTTFLKLDFLDRAFGVELFKLKDEPYDAERFRRRRAVRFDGEEAFALSPEDVVVTKTRWVDRAQRPKDRDDLLQIIKENGATFDWAYIERWCAELGVSETLV